jgi:glycosyltransferase involved in cell wall biosynthesis
LYFSIITPTFNSSRYIIKNIDSLNKQKFINFEQIIIDNLSTDKTLEIIKKRANYKIRIFSKKDKGIYNAMNKGSVLARGKFLLFLNSDDWLEKNSLELVANTILKNSNYTVYYGDSNFYNKKSFQFKHNSNIDEILKTNSISHQATYYKKDIFRKYKYNEKYKVGADYDFTIKLIKDKYKFFYINSILSNNSLGGYSSNLHQSFNDFYKIQLKNNGALTAYKNIILEYHYKLICVFIKKLCKII